VAVDPDTAPADEDGDWPVYWPLQSIAMGRALYGLAKCPHFWAKTPHRA
jgi:hypothetical protein